MENEFDLSEVEGFEDIPGRPRPVVDSNTGLKADTKAKKYERIKKRKMDTSSATLCHGFAPEFERPRSRVAQMP